MALLCTNAAGGGRFPLPRGRAHPYAVGLSAPVSVLRSRRGLPTRGLRCAGADWPEQSFVAVAEKPDAAEARMALASAGDGGGGEEEEDGPFEAINGAGGNNVEESVILPPFEQSLVAADSVGEDALGRKLDFKETSTYVMYGSSAFIAGWILSAVVSAIDSIPLFPKIMQIVGLGYTIWFSTRYLLFKENRDEMFVKVDDLKRRITGYGDE
ncbi:protein CURVATURE THYLAKOID 1A, chloroplastic-like [Oryza brachyantha]|uniref:protein CURVATURE THYLAKOID 1A, chloroplastic-like n=1 Tax=Oryza brachyantha TaxID=4533 RepID=UPI001ADB1596|nr:protein CURVATURE THYLAKOID 1A, chloroplastic-like [Oryza brachyantha]